jgi:arginine N-succinyltransferase
MNAPDTAPARFLLRPARPEDLPALERFAAASAFGITTLPPDRALLADRLARSAAAFANDDAASGEEIYLFVVEDLARGEPVGTSGIAASAGFAGRFYSYRSEYVVHASPALGASNRTHTLHLCHDLTGVTLLTSFYVEPAYAATLAPQLLSRGRLLFIAQFADRFSDRIAAESPGLADDSGRCPFWDAVGRRFFDMDYPAVERLAVGRSKSFIAELMPHSPIYVPLLPEEAQWAIGQLHPVGELPFSILIDEGFDPDTYVDIFDGGPTAHARVAMLRTVAASREARVADTGAAAGAPAPHPGWQLAANTRRDAFRAVLLPAGARGGPLSLTAEAAIALGVYAGDALRVAPLGVGGEGGNGGRSGSGGNGIVGDASHGRTP